MTSVDRSREIAALGDAVIRAGAMLDCPDLPPSRRRRLERRLAALVNLILARRHA